jgi:hypothetical protein
MTHLEDSSSTNLLTPELIDLLDRHALEVVETFANSQPEELRLPVLSRKSAVGEKAMNA